MKNHQENEVQNHIEEKRKKKGKKKKKWLSSKTSSLLPRIKDETKSIGSLLTLLDNSNGDVLHLRQRIIILLRFCKG